MYFNTRNASSLVGDKRCSPHFCRRIPDVQPTQSAAIYPTDEYSIRSGGPYPAPTLPYAYSGHSSRINCGQSENLVASSTSSVLSQGNATPNLSNSIATLRLKVPRVQRTRRDGAVTIPTLCAYILKREESKVIRSSLRNLFRQNSSARAMRRKSRRIRLRVARQPHRQIRRPLLEWRRYRRRRRTSPTLTATHPGLAIIMLYK